MDLKGVSNIYQKFEAMCLEVEEVIYEDTVKYVENQAQKVGASVKKFYSEVIQDLIPPSCVDPMKVSDSSITPYTHTDKKTKLPLNGHNNESISEITATKISSLCRQNESPVSCSPKNKKTGVYKRPVGIKRISRTDCPSKISPVVKNDNGGGVNENKCLFDAPVESPVSDKVILVESVRPWGNDYECTSSCSGLKNESTGTFMSDATFCEGGSSIISKARDVESVGEKVMMSNEGARMKDGSFSPLSSNLNNNTCNVVYVTENVMFDEDNFHMEVIENYEVAEPRVEIAEPVEKSNLEETCVLVEGDNVHFFPQWTGKHKWYKKKIREALSSKLQSTRKQGYDQSVSQYNDFVLKNQSEVTIPALLLHADERKLPSPDFLESEWEIL